METRKIQLAGGSTYTVSLPKQWAEEHGLEAGTNVQLHPHIDGSLVIRSSPFPNGGPRQTRVAVDRLNDANLERTVQALYVTGFDRFTLTTSSGFTSEQRRRVSAAAQKLVGVEILKETDNRIELQTLLNSDDVSVRQSTLQLQFIALSMHEDATTALTACDADLAAQVIERDDEADRLFGMVMRHFQRALTDLQEVDALEMNRATLFDYYATARQLERVADHAEKLARVATQLEQPPGSALAEDLDETARQARGVVEDAASVLLGGADATVAYEALARRDDVTDTLATLDRALYTAETSERYRITLVIDSLTRTAEYGGNIAETALQAMARTDDL